MAAERRVATSRISRLTTLGQLATGIAGGAVTEATRQVALGRAPAIGELLLTPNNVRRLGDRLSEMRGAAMKVGQLLSMDTGHLLPVQLSQILARLRDGCPWTRVGSLQVTSGSRYLFIGRQSGGTL